MKRLTALWAVGIAVTFLGPLSSRAADPAVRKATETLKQYQREPFEQDKRTAALRDLGKIGGKEAAEAVLVVFGDPFEHLADRGVSAWINMVKRERADETVAWLAAKALKDRKAAVRAGAATALGFATGPEAGDALAGRMLKEKDPEVLVAILRAWARTESRRAWNPMDFLRHRDGGVVLATVEALRKRDQLDTIPPAWHESALDQKVPLARAAAVLGFIGLGALTPERAQHVLADPHELPRLALAEGLQTETERLPWEPIAREILRSLLSDASWRVRARAIVSVVSQWKPDAVPLLIARLEAEEGRLRLDLADALEALTGKTLGTDVELWRAWWAANETDFDPGPRPRGARPRTPTARGGEGESKTVTFFRLPVLSTRVAFLIDCSGSMRDPAIGDDVAGLTKMGLARQELSRTLAGLTSATAINVVLYRYPSEYPPRPKMTRAFKRLEPCAKSTAKKAEAWLAGQPAKGWGAFSDALDALLAEEEVDTIFFLSDGRPSRGRYDRDFRLITELERANRFRQVVVHTVLVGQKKADRTFLQELAEITGGHFADATRAPGGR